MWNRASEYEIKDGFIRPTKRAKIESYEPWDHWNRIAASRKKYKDETPAYVELVQLADRLKLDTPWDLLVGAGEPPKLSKDEEAGLLAWCSRYGLLGLLPHDVLAVSTGQSMFFREGGREWWGSPEGEQAIPVWFPRETAVTSFRKRIQNRPVEELWDRFFPEIADPRGYYFPTPLTEDFWRIYAEPVSDFLGYAQLFLCMLAPPGPTPVKGLAEGRELVVNLRVRLPEAISLLTAGCGPNLAPDPQGSTRWIQHWSSPSLLADLALMVHLDQVQGRPVVRCQAPDCGQPAQSKLGTRRYCGRRCRNRIRKAQDRLEARRLEEKAARGSAAGTRRLNKRKRRRGIRASPDRGSS